MTTSGDVHVLATGKPGPYTVRRANSSLGGVRLDDDPCPQKAEQTKDGEGGEDASGTADLLAPFLRIFLAHALTPLLTLSPPSISHNILLCMSVHLLWDFGKRRLRGCGVGIGVAKQPSISDGGHQVAGTVAERAR